MMGIALVIGLGLFACGDDDDDTAASGSASASASEAESDDGDLETYCEKSVEIETLLAGEPDVDFETATEEEIAAAMQDFAAQGVPVAEELEAAVPEENRENIEILSAALAEVAETGEFEAFESPEVDAAGTADHEYALANCGWEQVDVTAVNYAFEGLPDELEAGVASFELANEGTELHEFVLVRKNDDTTESFEELLALPQDEAQAKISFAASAFATPGEENVYALADLTPGEYLAVCFIPVGTVDEETVAEGPPHFTQGMQHELTVS
jgi:hypothetical protein